VKAGHWPKLKKARGKFVFLLLTALDTDGLSGYLHGHPNLEGRAAFLESRPGQDYAAFLLMDNATVRAREIPELVKQGYLVRARADIETWEAKVNDPSRARQALASGRRSFRPISINRAMPMARITLCNCREAAPCVAIRSMRPRPVINGQHFGPIRAVTLSQSLSKDTLCVAPWLQSCFFRP
jgi:hypothetical protein